jgi:hypothetical protein
MAVQSCGCGVLLPPKSLVGHHRISPAGHQESAADSLMPLARRAAAPTSPACANCPPCPATPVGGYQSRSGEARCRAPASARWSLWGCDEGVAHAPPRRWIRIDLIANGDVQMAHQVINLGLIVTSALMYVSLPCPFTSVCLVCSTQWSSPGKTAEASFMGREVDGGAAAA